MKRFDKDRYLKKLKLKRFFQNYSKYLYLGLSCFLVCVLEIYFAFSKFFVSREEEVVKTTVGNFIYGDIVIGAYIDGEYSSTIPGKNDGYVVEKIACDNDTIGEWNYEKWGLLTTNMTNRTKCNVYFKKGIKIAEKLDFLDTTGKCPTINDDGTSYITTSESENSLLCSAPDVYGTSYYYRGNVTNNYVKFAGIYWRIIRVNGDGSIRMIYDGTVAHANGEASDDRIIGQSAFNDKDDDNAYIGYMYGTPGSSTYKETHANINDSTLKKYIDTWYKNNVKGTSYEKYIVDNIFCDDRSVSSNKEYPNLGYGSSRTTYRWYYGTGYNPNNENLYVGFNCWQQNDAFTVNDTINGNGALTYPIGAITPDETIFAGGWSEDNLGYYLYSGVNYWALGADNANIYTANIGVYNTGMARRARYVIDIVGVKPVINIQSTVLKDGDGTMNNPYRLSVDS